ncbi:Alpha-L-fucosidase (EC [Lentimonas sp. CC19]|nr:Alpha-L-fucosidase (EC [Lentimonas sp. CC4]CAA6686071.1 Alpha-L-fucosidase (EC [Lentimonas sp. CC6]CAA6691551.1 Alpha-L-fucosidase (EC [Lentimonas sp. CC19]CAA6692204.1 Alpha-L-fucosidase (EC [Lentimonas sp. CC10]CAA7070151.1 Alpha-L-fucosidase (EC [Lentimonas sp. CC11]CAA7168521.1 Alpha-L-fucosidase (EC [Lentimonas sp. CC21]CAA7182984.1 Alpha-L-fucosidase (EC [Lentimonas sp. CC8]
MDKMWGDRNVRVDVESSERAALFRDGNYGMFIHWGLYSQLGGEWKGETFYGIGEWIKRQMGIPTEEYMAIANDFNPVDFDANAIVATAKAAGMKYIIITSKHHEGFAMFKSAHPFNIVDATPFARDPMQELADACRAEGLGFGFYYSHNQDWTAPGGTGGPELNPDGSEATFEEYFREKCYPQVKEICTNYGPLSFVWFDTPRGMPEEMVVELADLVRETQPDAMLCSRIGFGMGDYVSLGDMQVPASNHEGLWETCDTTNDSWSYAWYDNNWKDAKTILGRLVATVARGGTYLLNVGPDGKGRIPAPAVKYLEQAGDWIKQNPGVVYAADASPWGAALPWGDVTIQGDLLNLVVFDWPKDHRIYLPGLNTEIESATLRTASGELIPLTWTKVGNWSAIEGGELTAAQISGLASVIELKLKGDLQVDAAGAVHPNIETLLPTEFASVEAANQEGSRWMEKFGEWKHVTQVNKWRADGIVTWDIDVAEAGDYYVSLSYLGVGRAVWSIETDEGTFLQNQQPATSGYHSNPMGLLSFKTPGKHTISVRLVDGDRLDTSLKSLSLSPVNEL